MEISIRDLIEVIRDVTSALNNSNWLVGYLIPILNVFPAASATLVKYVV